MDRANSDNPRISFNQLTKYLTASPIRKRSIVIQQKRPRTFMMNYYRPAEQAIVSFFLGSGKDEEIIVRAIEELYSKEAKTDNARIRLKSNIDALQAFLDSYEQLDFEEFRKVRGKNSCPKIKIAGVNISVRPEIILYGEYKGKSVTGAIKLYFAKNERLIKNSASYMSTILSQLISKYFTNNSVMSEKHCIVYDVFAGRAYPSPITTTRGLRNVLGACKEIARKWDALDKEELD